MYNSAELGVAEELSRILCAMKSVTTWNSIGQIRTGDKFLLRDANQVMYSSSEFELTVFSNLEKVTPHPGRVSRLKMIMLDHLIPHLLNQSSV